MTEISSTEEDVLNGSHSPPSLDLPADKCAAFKKKLQRATVPLGLLAILTGCGGSQSMMDSAGTGARETLNIWWVMFWIGTVVFLFVLGLLWFAVTYAKNDSNEAPGSTKSRTRLVLLGGIVMPVIIIAVVFIFSTRGLVAIGNLGGDDTVTIDIVAHQYWWEVTYPDEGVVTANEIHIPVGESVQLRLTASDVIHSFWVPALHGKIDVMPGHTTSITLNAEEAGTFRGQCAQFCGVQHANMAFIVEAQEPEEYQAWLTQQAQPADAVPDAPNLVRGQDVFMSSMCVYCHTVEGTAANGTLGPDLTHIGSRQTLGAGILSNNRGNLAAWIVDPQGVKPGNHMPGITLDGEDLNDLLDFLESLD